MRHLQVGSCEVRFLGPETGCLPGFFYFALSAEESLTLAPINEPVRILSELPIRLYSITLPAHFGKYEPTEAMRNWARTAQEGSNPILGFAETASQAIDTLIAMNLLDPTKVAVGGLSRGGFAALHVAALNKNVKHILGFAPLTNPFRLHEYQGLETRDYLQRFCASSLIPDLLGKNVRFFIGNRDERVSTRACFDFVEELSQANYQAGHRVAPVECYITPSIGHQGHGTAPSTFAAGASWIAKQLHL